MSKKTATPDEIAQALAMRAAGYSVLSISQALGISIRSLQRHFASHGARKGAIKQDLLDSARAELLKRVTSDDAIREEAAKLINDDLAHARLLRSRMADATEHLTANNLEEAALLMRAAAAYSTALKNTSDTLRRSLRIERTIDDDVGELPELVISELTPEDIARMKANQAEEEALSE